MESTQPSLLIRIRNKDDSEAWMEFFELYSPLMYSYARERGLGHEDAEDIRASCYETIVKRIGEFDYSAEQTGFRAWLRTLVSHRVIDLYRKKKMPLAESSDLRTLPDIGDSIDDLWEKNWRLHHLRYCVSQVGKRVKPESYEVFRCLSEQGMSVEAVCQRMHMNANQVYKIKSRFLELVRAEMKNFDLED